MDAFIESLNITDTSSSDAKLVGLSTRRTGANDINCTNCEDCGEPCDGCDW